MPRRLIGISSMATRQIFADVIGAFVRGTAQEVEMESVGGVDAARRVRVGEPFDLVALASEAVEKLEAEGLILPGSRRGFARSPMALAIRAGAARPDISDAQAVRRAVAQARAVGFSTGPSGAQVVRLLKAWGLEGPGGPQTVQATPGVPVGSLVARGEVEIGFQQLSELMDEPGIEIVGLLPPEIQSETVFSIGVGSKSSSAGEARGFIAYLVSPDTTDVKRRRGMEPA